MYLMRSSRSRGCEAAHPPLIVYLSGMYLSYFDESGDDGYPKYSSEIFVLTSIYFHNSVWQENYRKLHILRKFLYQKFNFPVKQEFHTREFITDKDPYHGVYSPAERKQILTYFCKAIQKLDLKIISVVIDKKKINRPAYDVLKNALTYNVQRIENDLNYIASDSKFLIITDEGRVGKMRATTRAIQRFNYIPSLYNPDSYRKEIKNLIEDPLPKRSSESYFIQLADTCSFIVSLYAKQNCCSTKMAWGKRVLQVLNYGDELALMDILKPKFNLKANRKNAYGIVCYPDYK